MAVIALRMLGVLWLAMRQDDPEDDDAEGASGNRATPGRRGAELAMASLRLTSSPMTLSTLIAPRMQSLVPSLRDPATVEAPAAGPGLLTAAMRAGRPLAPDGKVASLAGSIVKGFEGRNEHANGWPSQVRPFAGAQQHLYKAFLFKAFEGWPKQMMAKAIGLNTGAYGYNPFGGGMSAEPAINAGHPETNLCYGLLETWLRSCSRPSMMLQTSLRVDRSSSSIAPDPPTAISRAELGKLLLTARNRRLVEAIGPDVLRLSRSGGLGGASNASRNDSQARLSEDDMIRALLQIGRVGLWAYETHAALGVPELRPYSHPFNATAGWRPLPTQGHTAAARSTAVDGSPLALLQLGMGTQWVSMAERTAERQTAYMDVQKHGLPPEIAQAAPPPSYEISAPAIGQALALATGSHGVSQLQMRLPAMPASPRVAASAAPGGGPGDAPAPTVAARQAAVASLRDDMTKSVRTVLASSLQQEALADAASRAPQDAAAAVRRPRTGLRPAVAGPSGGAGPARPQVQPPPEQKGSGGAAERYINKDKGQVIKNNSPIDAKDKTGINIFACIAHYFGQAGFPFGYLSAIIYSTACIERFIFKGLIFGGAFGAEPKKTAKNPANEAMKSFMNLVTRIFNIGAPRGGRVTFAAPEEYDENGLYGPEPFPFQTPGAEKCHRMMNTWIHKCEAVQ